MRDRLYRSRRIKVFGGVAGGLSVYFNIDPIIVRILFVALTVMHGVGLLVYIIMWIVVPEEPFELAYPVNNDKHDQAAGESSAQTSDENFVEQEVKKSSTGRFIAGSILIILGIVFFADRFIPSFDLGDVVPIIFIFVGGLLIWNSLKK